MTGRSWRYTQDPARVGDALLAVERQLLADVGEVLDVLVGVEAVRLEAEGGAGHQHLG